MEPPSVPMNLKSTHYSQRMVRIKVKQTAAFQQVSNVQLETFPKPFTFVVLNVSSVKVRVLCQGGVRGARACAALMSHPVDRMGLIGTL